MVIDVRIYDTDVSNYVKRYHSLIITQKTCHESKHGFQLLDKSIRSNANKITTKSNCVNIYEHKTSSSLEIERETGNADNSGRFGNVESSGFVIDLPNHNATYARDTFRKLINSSFVDVTTR